MKQEKQMHKKFYCKMEKQIMMFVSHINYKDMWICTSCRFTTSNPITQSKMPQTKKPDMKKFWKEMAKKTMINEPRKNVVMTLRSC